MDINLQLTQRQTLSRQQIQYLQMLALSNEELNRYMENEYLENPMLEKADSVEENGTSKDISEVFSTYDVAAESENAARPEMAAKPKDGLLDFVLSQLDLRKYTKREQEIFAYLALNLDTRGFLLTPSETAAAQLHTTAADIDRCIQILQTLEPAGIFAGNLEECFVLQMKRREIYTEESAQIVRHYLKELADGQYNVISKALHISTITVRKAAALIATLNPYPLQGYNDEETHYIVPDVLVRIQDGREKNWEITLNRDNLQLYRISDFYLHMLETARDPELSEYFQTRLSHARFLLKAMEQREKTIRSIVKAVLDWQREYIQCGLPLRGMTMQDIGDACGIHASTVSRAVRNKYLEYPGGTVLIKNLFTAMHTEKNPETAQSPDRIKRRISELVNAEDKHHPYSDQTMTEMLSAENLAVSRRTVAKYRKELGIAPTSARKQI